MMVAVVGVVVVGGLVTSKLNVMQTPTCGYMHSITVYCLPGSQLRSSAKCWASLMKVKQLS